MFNLSYLFLVISIDLPLCYTKAYMIINQNTLYTLTIGNPKCPQTRLNQTLSMYQAINLYFMLQFH